MSINMFKFGICGAGLFGVVSLLTVAMPFAHAQEPKAEETVSVIQNRIYDRYHEVDFLLGYVPDDDFYQAYPIGLSYTYHFNEFIAWEVIRAQGVFNRDRDLKKKLEKEYEVAPTEFDEIKAMVHTNFIFKPTYGKDAVWNDGIMNHEGYLVLGLGAFNYERKYSDGSDSSETAASVSLGIGRKYFIDQTFSINLELRDYITLKESGTENNVYLGIALGYRFNMAPRVNTRKQETDTIYRYLKDDGEGSQL